MSRWSSSSSTCRRPSRSPTRRSSSIRASWSAPAPPRRSTLRRSTNATSASTPSTRPRRPAPAHRRTRTPRLLRPAATAEQDPPKQVAVGGKSDTNTPTTTYLDLALGETVTEGDIRPAGLPAGNETGAGRSHGRHSGVVREPGKL
ncbi:exported hypothetical protein [Frankia sp. AiPs1]